VRNNFSTANVNLFTFLAGLFEQRVSEYRDEMSKIVNPLRDVKVFGKKLLGFSEIMVCTSYVR
jgi:hypothetical protein